ncbi:MAG: hypothetical protein FD180_1169 [Planctomycetota bacterium]|nr:MAG: hypothetical protein FD180_1169 [Planctomycetota bacterium]
MSLIYKLLEKTGLYVATASNVTPGQKPPAEILITTTKVVSIKELCGAPTDVIAGPKGFQATPEDVYAAAKIKPPDRGMTVEKFRELAAKPLYKDMSPQNRQKALLAELATAGVPSEEVVADAVRKDQALDSYERFLVNRLAQSKKEFAATRSKLEADIVALAGVEKKLELDFEAWKKTKQAREKELAEALAPLTSESRISLS